MLEIPGSGSLHAGNHVTQIQEVPTNAPLRDLAQQFEAAFMSEMLRHSGLGKMPDGFNGGPGEARFSGFLVEAYADQLSASGQIGLADRIYRDLVARGAE